MMRALILVGVLSLFASSAWAACKPVVYAFRHAEDSTSFALNPVGKRHAELYKTMVADFEATFLGSPDTDKKPCRVTKVYAVTTDEKDQPCTACLNATNSFNTAKPLAADRMTGLDPIAPIDPITKLALPITRVGNLKLFEYLGNGNDEPLDSKSDLYTNPTASALRAALVATANLEQSSAIFWTSQGLHVLGGAIINKNSAVPRKNGWTLPPRNAVYLFKAIGSAPNITGFEDTRTTDTHTPPSAVYIQCFNWVGATNQPDITPQPVQGFIPPDGSPLTQNYYCGFGDLSSPGGKPTEGCSVTDPNADCGDIPFAKTGDLLGKICDTTDTASMLKKSSGALFTGDKLYGGCQGPAQ